MFLAAFAPPSYSVGQLAPVRCGSGFSEADGGRWWLRMSGLVQFGLQRIRKSCGGVGYPSFRLPKFRAGCIPKLRDVWSALFLMQGDVIDYVLSIDVSFNKEYREFLISILFLPINL